MSIPSLATPAVVVLLVALAPRESGAATALAALEPGVRDEIVRRCLPTQYRDGADAYRNCVADGVAARTDDAGPRVALEALSLDDRYAIERVCETEGADCVSAQLDALDGAPDPFVDGLDEDERHVVRRQCFAVQGEGGVAAYRRCLDEALAGLDGLPEPDLDALTLVERNALALRCSAADATAADYRRCLLESSGADVPDVAAAPAALRAVDDGGDRRAEPDALGEARADDAEDARTDASTAFPDDAALPGEGAGDDDAVAALDVGAIAPDPDVVTEPPPRTTTDGTPAGSDDTVVRRVILPAAARPDDRRDATGSIDDEPPVTDRQTAGAASEALEPDAADAERTIDAPDSAGPEEGRERTDEGAATPPEADPDAPAPDLRERAVEARERLVASVAGLDETQRIVFGAALALPLLLLGVWAVVSRGGTRSRPLAVEPIPPIRNAGLVERVSPPLDHDLAREPYGHAAGPDDLDDERFLGDLDLDDPPPAAASRPAARPSAPSPSDSEPAPPIAAASVPPAEDDAGSNDGMGDGMGDGVGDGPAGDVAPFVPRSEFGRRLLLDETPLTRQHAIEFLIYWMAYGDDRYEPEMRAALLRDGGDDGDPHDLIKRHVLEEDTLAFADVVRWMQRSTHELERVQVLDLLMVLLIAERAMTPSQNTLLHFLADAFGLGAKTLDERHEEAFGTPMPPLARTDLAAWWEKVEPDRPLRWDARAVAGLDEPEQFRIRLGLPLEGEIGESEIVEGFRRAARRCHPHRFDALGERERALAERQFAKFEEARDRLLGVRP